MNKKIELIEDPSPEDGFEGMYLGIPGYYDDPPLDFDLHKADEYIKKNNLHEITEDIKKMFPLKNRRVCYLMVAFLDKII